MIRSEVETGVFRVLASILSVPRLSVNHEASRATLDEWDSLKHMQVILALEDDFKVEFSDIEISELDSASGLIQAIVAKTAEVRRS